MGVMLIFERLKISVARVRLNFHYGVLWVCDEFAVVCSVTGERVQ